MYLHNITVISQYYYRYIYIISLLHLNNITVISPKYRRHISLNLCISPVPLLMSKSAGLKQ